MHRPKGVEMTEGKTSGEIAAEETAKAAEEEATRIAAEEEGDESNEGKDDLEATNKRLLSESIKNKKGRQKAEKELEKIREEKLSADEKKDLRIKKLEEEKLESDRQLKDSSVDSMITNYASTLGFQDLDVVKLIARKDLDDEDEISEADVKSVIDSIAKEKPYLLGGGDTTKVGLGNFEGGNNPPKEEKTLDERFGDALKAGMQRNEL